MLEAFRAIVRDIAEQELPTFDTDTAIVDLGVESLAMYEVVGELERRYGVRFTDGELVAARTVGDLLTVVAARPVPAA